MTIEEKAKAYDDAVNKLRRFMAQGVEPLITRADVQDFFPELAKSKDEMIREKLIEFFKDWGKRLSHCWGLSIPDILAWLEKQGKSMWTDEDEERLQSCIIALQGKGLMGGVDTIDTKWLKSLKQRIHVSSAKPCKNDNLLDLLNKMPSCITVNGVDYHFVLKKTSYYLAYYKGNKEEGRGNAIFGVTAFSPIELLTAMLNKLKKERLLE